MSTIDTELDTETLQNAENLSKGIGAGFEVIQWGAGDDLNLDIMQPFLRAGFIDDPDYALGKGGPEIYEQMLRHPVIGASLDVRIKSVSALTPRVLANKYGDPDKQKKQVKGLQRIVDEIKDSHLWIENSCDAIMMGSSYNEIIWNWNKRNEFVPFDLVPWNKQRVVFDNHGNFKVKTLEQMVHGFYVSDSPKGTKLKAGKFLKAYYNKNDTTNLNAQTLGYRFKGQGIGERLWRLYYIGYHTFGESALYAERFARPLILMQYPKGQAKPTASERSEFTKILRNGIILTAFDPSDPEAFKITVVDQKSKSGSDFLLKFSQECDSLIREVIQGNNLNSPTSTGAGTAGAKLVLHDVSLNYKLLDIKMCNNSFSEMLEFIRQFNPDKFDLSEPCPLWDLDFEKPIDEGIMLQKLAASKGLEVNTVELYEKLGWKLPDGLPDTMIYEGSSPQMPEQITGKDLLKQV